MSVVGSQGLKSQVKVTGLGSILGLVSGGGSRSKVGVGSWVRVTGRGQGQILGQVSVVESRGLKSHVRVTGLGSRVEIRLGVRGWVSD